MAPLARSAAEKALAIDPTHNEAHSILASMAASVDYQWNVADTHHRKALAVEPVPSQSRFRRAAWYLLPLGRVSEATEQVRVGLETDPLSMSLNYSMVLCRYVARQNRETIECARRALEIDTHFYPIWLTLGHAQLHLDLVQDAISSLTRVTDLAPWLAIGVGSLTAAYRASGDHERYQEWLRRLTERHNHTYGAAIYYALAGDADAMFEALDGAYRQRDVFLLYIQAMSFFDPYRADPRFRTLVAQMNLA
jgi:tetratricopeptide (TPR) repeat protein